VVLPLPLNGTVPNLPRFRRLFMWVADWTATGVNLIPMRRKRPIHKPDNDKTLVAFMEDVFPDREPTIRIYRIEPNEMRQNTRFRKQTRIGEVCLSAADNILQEIQFQFGAGTYLLRSVRLNGTYGPSRVVRIAERTFGRSSKCRLPKGWSFEILRRCSLRPGDVRRHNIGP